MCGIVGAITNRKDITAILLDGLQRLEYRGYDSAGIALINPEHQQIERIRVKGKVAKLAELIAKHPIQGPLGIAHTRWATHGKPSEINAHPHCSSQKVAVVHNGIIENYVELREKLRAENYVFETETDTEVVAHLLHFYSKSNPNFTEVIQQVAKELRGAYALGIIHVEEPKVLYAIRHGSPLVVGIGKDEHFIASDPLALLPVTNQFIYLEEGDIARLTIEEHRIYDKAGQIVPREIHTANITEDGVDKGQFRHFMLKEIFEQPQSILNTLNGYLVNEKVLPQIFGVDAPAIFKNIKRIRIVACGTSFHAGLVAKHWLEEMAQIKTDIEIASEYRYRHAVIEPDTLFIALSQSGETADTLAAVRLAKKQGYLAVLAICNIPESSLAREADLVFLTRAGTEVGVAATKTFTAQLMALLLLALCLSKKPSVTSTDLEKLPGLIEKILENDAGINDWSKFFKDKVHTLFLGRGILYPIALEGALKLKEISYIHAEAYPAGELKHGPLALVDKDMPVIIAVCNDHLVEKIQSNMQEVQARGGELFVFIDEAIKWQPEGDVHVIKIPSVNPDLAPILYVIALQLLSYHIAVIKGTDVDQPRNLAKSVTVE